MSLIASSQSKLAQAYQSLPQQEQELFRARMQAASAGDADALNQLKQQTDLSEGDLQEAARLFVTGSLDQLFNIGGSQAARHTTGAANMRFEAQSFSKAPGLGNLAAFINNNRVSEGSVLEQLSTELRPLSQELEQVEAKVFDLSIQQHSSVEALAQLTSKNPSSPPTERRELEDKIARIETELRPAQQRLDELSAKIDRKLVTYLGAAQDPDFGALRERLDDCRAIAKETQGFRAELQKAIGQKNLANSNDKTMRLLGTQSNDLAVIAASTAAAKDRIFTASVNRIAALAQDLDADLAAFAAKYSTQAQEQGASVLINSPVLRETLENKHKELIAIDPESIEDELDALLVQSAEMEREMLAMSLAAEDDYDSFLEAVRDDVLDDNLDGILED